MTGGIHHASNYDMSQICQRGFYYIQKYFPYNQFQRKLEVHLVLLQRHLKKNTLLLKKFTLSATIMFMLNSLTLPHRYMGTYT